MASITPISISGENVRLMNKGKMNSITVQVDLSNLWKRISSHTDIYITVVISVPVIENGALKSMLITLESKDKVENIDFTSQKMSVGGEFPGIIDTSQQHVPSGKAAVMYYDVLDI